MASFVSQPGMVVDLWPLSVGEDKRPRSLQVLREFAPEYFRSTRRRCTPQCPEVKASKVSST